MTYNVFGGMLNLTQSVSGKVRAVDWQVAAVY